MGGYHYWKGGDDDPQDQVGVDPTAPAVSGPTAGPPSVYEMDTLAALEELQATRDRLADLEGEYELTKARFTDFAEEAFERNRQHVVQVEDLDRVVSLANAERDEVRDRLADLEGLLREIAEWGLSPVLWKRLHAALDGPAAQEEDRGG